MIIKLVRILLESLTIQLNVWEIFLRETSKKDTRKYLTLLVRKSDMNNFSIENITCALFD